MQNKLTAFVVQYWACFQRFNFDFLLLSLFVLFFNLPAFSALFFPIHDTLEAFTYFYYFYNEWFFNGQIARWFPYGTYGLPAFLYQFRDITPVDYLVMLFGGWFRVENVLVLFKSAIVLEQLIFLSGMYRLSRLLFEKRAVVFLIGLAAAGSTVWYGWLHWNFRIFYLFPFVAYYLLCFFRKGEARFFWLAGLAGCCWFIGANYYFISLWLFFFSIFLIVLFLRSPRAVGKIIPRRKSDWVVFSVFVMLSTFIAVSLAGAMKGMHVTAMDREISGVNSIEDFLTYGGTADWPKIIRTFFLAQPAQFPTAVDDSSLYAGLLTAFFFMWAVVWGRRSVFFAFLAGLAALVWLSFGGAFARLAYHFPLMAFYRHIGLVYGFVRVLVLVCAGFGLDHFWKSGGLKKAGGTVFIAGIILLVLQFVPQPGIPWHTLWSPRVLIQNITEVFATADWREMISEQRFPLISLAGIFLTATVYELMKGNKKAGVAAVFLKLFFAAFLIFDLTLWHARVFNRIAKLEEPRQGILSATRVSRMEYQPVRLPAPQTERQRNAYDLVMLSDKTSKYVTAHNFIQMDVCDPGFRVNFLLKGVHDLISIPGLKRFFVGCYSQKLRLVPLAIRAKEKDAAFLMRDMDLEQFQRTVILEKSDRFIPAAVSALPGRRGRIHAARFGSNELEAEVVVPFSPGAWLVYADAYDPAWRAKVDGCPEKIEPANIAFKAVFVKEGTHRVRFYYGLSGSLPGIILALTACAFGIFLCGFWGRCILVKVD